MRSWARPYRLVLGVVLALGSTSSALAWQSGTGPPPGLALDRGARLKTPPAPDKPPREMQSVALQPPQPPPGP
jgi:hypothetical protein